MDYHRLEGGLLCPGWGRRVEESACTGLVALIYRGLLVFERRQHLCELLVRRRRLSAHFHGLSVAGAIQSPAVGEAHPVLDRGVAHIAVLGLLHSRGVWQGGDWLVSL